MPTPQDLGFTADVVINRVEEMGGLFANLANTRVALPRRRLLGEEFRAESSTQAGSVGSEISGSLSVSAPVSCSACSSS